MGVRTIEYGGPAVTLHASATSFTTPIASGGADISGWRRGNCGPSQISLVFTAPAATVITGPLGVYEERDDGTINEGALINDGADIIIPNGTTGKAYVVYMGDAKKLQIGRLPDANNLTGATSTPTNSQAVTVKATPRWEVEQ